MLKNVQGHRIASVCKQTSDAGCTLISILGSNIKNTRTTSSIRCTHVTAQGAVFTSYICSIMRVN